MTTICEHHRIKSEPYDFGKDPQTGYYDTGIAHTCLDCGEVLYDEELEALRVRPTE